MESSITNRIGAVYGRFLNRRVIYNAYMNAENKEWARNLTHTEDGIFRTTNGTADELIGIGRTIKAGFACSRVDITNSRYDAIVEIGPPNARKLLRVQIRGVAPGGQVSFTGGTRSGQQIDRNAQTREYKYTKDDIDIFMAVDTSNGDCFIIPVEDLSNWGKTKSLSTLGKYKENWNILVQKSKEICNTIKQ